MKTIRQHVYLLFFSWVQGSQSVSYSASFCPHDFTTTCFQVLMVELNCHFISEASAA